MGLATRIIYGVVSGGFFIAVWESFAVYYGENSILHQCAAFSGCPSNYAQGASDAGTAVLALGIASVVALILTVYVGFFWKPKNAAVVPSDTSDVHVLPPGQEALPDLVPKEADEPKLDHLLERIDAASQKQGVPLDALSSNANVLLGFLSLELVAFLTAAFTSIVRVNGLVGAYAIEVLLGAGFALVCCLVSNLGRSRADPRGGAVNLASWSSHQLKWYEVRVGLHDFGWNEFFGIETVKVFEVGIGLFIAGNALLAFAMVLG